MAKRVRKRPTQDRSGKIEHLLGGQSAPAAGGEPLRHFPADEHIARVEQRFCRLTKGQGWTPLTYADWQKREIRRMLALRPDGTLRYSTAMPCWPRRCDKTGWITRYEIDRAAEYDDQLIVIQGNSADQGAQAVLGEIAATLTNSPDLATVDGTGERGALYNGVEFSIQTEAIHFANGSRIVVWPAAGASTLGRGVSVYHNTEGCLAASDANYQVGASSIGDKWCGIAFIDSNMGSADNMVARYVELGQLAEAEARAAEAEGREIDPSIGDPQICASYICFDDLDDVLTRGCGVGLGEGEEPLHWWLDAAWIRSRYAQMTRSEFARNHCNLPSNAGEALWTDEQINPLFLDGLPAIIRPERMGEAARTLAADGTWSIGVGLDRAGAFSKLPDRTVLAVVGRTCVAAWRGRPVDVFDDRGNKLDAEICDGSLYVVLAAWSFMRHLRDPLQNKLLEIHRTWGIGRCQLEAYQASDLAEWCELQPFGARTEIRHMTPQAKHQLVSFAHGLVVTRRLVASTAHELLRREMLAYREIDASGSTPSYGGKRTELTVEIPLLGGDSGRTVERDTWIKDDYLEAVLWAIDAARDARPKRSARVLAKPAGL